MLAEAARASGYRVIALDLFADRDTRRVAEVCLPIGDAASLVIDGDALVDALGRARTAGAQAWVAGSGFDGHPELLAAGQAVLPLAGNPPEVAARVRDPAQFYGRLAALGIPHPQTRCERPPSPRGWLRKNAASSGGWDVRAARPDDADAESSIYYQRIAAGAPMSALFVADGRRSRLVGVNMQIVRPFCGRPFVFHGCIGPVGVAPSVRCALEAMLDALVADFGLRGLNGLDFLLDDDEIRVIELNPRPPASIALYPDALPEGLLRAHVEASLDGRLPAPERHAAADMRGFETVFAQRAWSVGAPESAVLAQQTWCHDLPVSDTSIGRGEPLCTVSAAGGNADEVEALLSRRRRQIPFLMEQANERSSESARGRALECQ
nr:ATP-grasp domain-containing protein [Aromatoleum toluvorans]